MENKQHVLSSEEALDEYFTALLDEEWQDEPVVQSEDNSRQETAVKQAETLAEVAKHSFVAAESVSSAEAEAEMPELQRAPVTEAKAQPDFHPAYTETEPNVFEVPDLKDVQKLLDKLESFDHADEPEIVTIIEQNTAEIVKAVAESTKVEVAETTATELKTEVKTAESQIEAEEIQDWVIEVAEPAISQPEAEVTQQQELEVENAVELQARAGGLGDYQWSANQRDESFQVLYFDVNGVTFAVPLDELGGIHRSGELSHLIGRPAWYLGLQTSKDDQLDVVDTAKWVMAERLRDDSYKDDYKYVVMLGLSKWGLASTELKGTESLSADMVRWRETAGKRPWLAGMVKEKMCALIHVEAMVTMLNAGLDVKSLDSE